MESIENRFKLRLGIFVATGLGIMLVIVFFVGKQKNLFDSNFKLRAMFKNVGGIQVGNHVRYSGINVGVVDNIIILSDSSIEITMIVDNTVRRFIKKDALASVGSEGLMGDKLINIGQGTFNSKEVSNNFLITTSEPIETDEILANLLVTSQNTEIISSQLADILFKVNNGNGTLARLIRDSSIAENLSQTIINLKSGSKNLNQNMEAAKGSILLRGFFKKKRKEEERLKKSQDNTKK